MKRLLIPIFAVALMAAMPNVTTSIVDNETYRHISVNIPGDNPPVRMCQNPSSKERYALPMSSVGQTRTIFVAVYPGSTCSGTPDARLSASFMPPARFRVTVNLGKFSLIKE